MTSIVSASGDRHEHGHGRVLGEEVGKDTVVRQEAEIVVDGTVARRFMRP